MKFSDLKPGNRFFLRYLVEDDPDCYLPHSIELLVKLKKPVIRNVRYDKKMIPRAHHAIVESSRRFVDINEDTDVIKLI